MKLRTFLKLIGPIGFTLYLSGCSAKTVETPAVAEQYYEMTEEKQAETLETLIRLFEHSEEVSNQGNQRLSVVYEADASQDVIRAVGTYGKVVSEKQLVKAKKLIAKIQADVNPCDRQEFKQLAEYGIGFQAVMYDLNGIILYESEICRGMVSNPLKLRGLNASL